MIKQGENKITANTSVAAENVADSVKNQQQESYKTQDRLQNVSRDGKPFLHIDLDAMARNYRIVEARTLPAKTSAVIKSNAYGMGSVPVMHRLAIEGCRDFWLADLAEIEPLHRSLKESGHYKLRDFRFYILNGLGQHKIDDFLTFGAIPVLNHVTDIERWNNIAPFIVHIDTGMNRMGLSVDDLCRLYEKNSYIFKTYNMAMVMSHLACADDPDHSLNRQQLAQFKSLMNGFFAGKRASLANSSGTFLSQEFHFDMVRTGAALYGIKPSENSLAKLENVATVTAPILQIRAAEGGETVSYSALHKIGGDGARLAVVGIGYAHGIFANPQRDIHVQINNQILPVVGRVSMDSIVVDISSLPENALTIGDRVEILGKSHDVNSVAREFGTLGYEVLTRFGALPHRSYSTKHRTDK